MENLLSRPPEELRELFLSLESPRDVADLIEIKYSRLVYHVYKVPNDDKYTTFYLPKKSDGYREICSPVTPLKIIQRKLNQILHSVYKPKPPVYSYVKNKNIVDNALKHRNRRYVFNVDLKDFFPSINFGRVRGMFIGKPYNLPENVSTLLAQICCFNNYIPQGAPTSPIISNMICGEMDSHLQALAMRNRCTYTRYADDITFSTSIKSFPISIAKVISLTEVEVGHELENIIKNNGFEVNKNKIRLQPKYRRQQVTGITVNEFPNVRRVYVRQIRAMLRAWNDFGIENAEKHFFIKWDYKHRNPDLEFPSFRQVVRGKIEFLGMVRGRNNPIYRRFINKFEFLERRDKGVPGLRLQKLDEINKSHIYTEGKTDRAILITAWNKLFDNAPMSFVIKDSDPTVKLKRIGGAGGSQALGKLMNGHRGEHPYIIIGIFDRDTDGMKEYKNLDTDYKEDPENDWKLSEDRRAGSFLLPVPEGKQDYVYYGNLCIEYYFSEDVLSKKTEDGYGLVFENLPIKVAGKDLPDDRQMEIKEARKIRDGKPIFAEKIVPILDVAEFENFRIIFEKVFNLIGDIYKYT